MLPFLKQDKKMSGAILESHRTPDAKPDASPEKDNSALEAAAEDILRAIASKDSKHLALALQACHDICEAAEPEDEQEDSTEPHSYESQK